MKKICFFVVLIIAIVVGVLCYFFISDTNQNNDKNIVNYDYIEDESNAIFYSSENGYIYAVADLTSHLENAKDLDYLVTGLFRKKAGKPTNKYELVYRINFCNYKEEGYKNMQFFDNKLYILDCPLGKGIGYIDLSDEELSLETLTKDYNKFADYRSSALKSISKDGVLIRMENYHEAPTNGIDVLCSLENENCEIIN